MSDDPIRATSAAVSLRPRVEVKSLAALSDDDLAHLADKLARAWVRNNRIGLIGTAGPLSACWAATAVIPVSHIELVLQLGFIGFLLGSFVSTIAAPLGLRALDLEVESLGYDRTTAQAVRAAYLAATRDLLPALGLSRKRRRCRLALEAARTRAADGG